MKVLLDSLHLMFTHKSFIQISYNHIKSNQSLFLGVKGLNTICIIIQN